jgi:hypothetical protein
MSKAFHKSLSFIRKTDAAVSDAVREIAGHVLSQWHQHGNKTPYMELQLALHGGIDSHGLFGKKGDTVRGVSKGIALAFSGIKLGKADATTDIDNAVTEAVSKGMKTRSEASEAAKARRDAREANKVEVEAPEPVTCALVLASGAAVKLSPAEAAALMKTLEALRAVNTFDAEEMTFKLELEAA